MGKSIRVKKGNEEYDVDESKLQLAIKDGFAPVKEEKLYTVVKGKDEYQVIESKLPEALADGFKKKSGGESISNVSPTPSGSGLSNTPNPDEIPIVDDWRKGNKYATGNFGIPDNTQPTETGLARKNEIKLSSDFAPTKADIEKENAGVKEKALTTTVKRSGRKKEEVQKDIDEGKLVLSSDGKGNKIYARQPGAGETFTRGLASAERGLVDAGVIATLKATGTPEDLAAYYEQIAHRKKVESEKEFSLSSELGGMPGASQIKDMATPVIGLPTAAPSTLGSLTEMVGGLAPDIALAAGTGGMGTAAKTAIIGGKMYTSSYANKAYELYEQGKQEAMAQGMDEKQASILAAQAATENAATAAIPDAAVNTLFFSGKLHSPAANNFISVMKGAAKDAVKVGGLGAAGSAATSAIEGAQGYNVDDWVDKALTSGGEFAKMDMLFKVIPILRTLPKAAQSAVKEFAVDPVVKPFVENYIQTLPEVQRLDISNDLAAYEAATKDIRGLVPEEKMASLGGRMQKRQNRLNGINILNMDIMELEGKKRNVPETFHEEIDATIKDRQSKIAELEKEVEGVDKEIESISKSKENGLEKEVDEATGEPIIPKEEAVKEPSTVTEKSAKQIANEEWENASSYEFTDTETGTNYKVKVAKHSDGSRTIELIDENLDNRFGGQIIKVSKDFKGTNEEAIKGHIGQSDGAEIKKQESKPSTVSSEVGSGGVGGDVELGIQQGYAKKAMNDFINSPDMGYSIHEEGGKTTLALSEAQVRSANGLKGGDRMQSHEHTNIELTKDEKKQLNKIESDKELGDIDGLEYAKQKRALAKKIFERASNELQQKANEQSGKDVVVDEGVVDNSLKDVETVAKKHFSDEAILSAKEAENNNEGVLINMPIDDFLSLNPKGDNADKRATVSKLVKEGTKFNEIPFLNFTHDGNGNAEVTGHEGRHRAMELKAQGETTIPVLLRNRAGGQGEVNINKESISDTKNFNEDLNPNAEKFPTKLRGHLEQKNVVIDFPLKEQSLSKQESVAQPKSENKPIQSKAPTVSSEVKTADEIRNESYIKLADRKDLTVEQKKLAIELNRKKELQEDAGFMKGKEKSQIENSARIINEKYDKQIAALENKPLTSEQEGKTPIQVQPPMEVPKPTEIKVENENQQITPENNEHIAPEEGKPVETTVVEESGGAGKEPPKEPSDKDGISVDNPIISFRKGSFVRARNHVGIEDFVDEGKTTHIAEATKAQREIEQWKDKGTYNENIADIQDRANDVNASVSNQEQFIFAKHLADLDATVNSIKDIYSPEYDKAHAEYKKALDAADNIRSKFGRGLGMIAKNKGVPQSLADMIAVKKDAVGSDTLTQKQKADVEKQFETIKKERDDFEKKYNEAQAKFTEMQAQSELSKPASKGKITTGKKDYKTERQSLKDRLKQEIADYKAAGQKMGIASDGGAESFVISAKIAKTITEIARTHVAETGAKIKEVVAKTLDDVKEFFGEGVSEKDIMDVLAGKYNEKRKTRSQLAADMREVQIEAKLLNEYQRLLEGGEPNNEKRKVARNKRLTELREKIKGLENAESDAKKAAEKEIEKLASDFEKEKRSEEKAKIKSKLDAAKELEKKLEYKTPAEQAAQRAINANKKAEQKIKEKIANKDFEEKPKPVTFWEDPSFKKNHPDLYKEVLDSYTKKEDAQHDFDVELLKDAESKKNLGQKALAFIGAGANTTKKIVTGIDDSSLFMQTLAAFAARPAQGVRAIKLHALDAFSKKRFERNLAELHNSPDWDLMQKSGLDVTEPKSLSAQNKEEVFSGKTWDISFKRKGKEYKVLETMLSPFERAFTSLGNGMRVIAFRDLAAKDMKEGKTFENDPKLFKDLATMLNTETGRGKQNEYLQKASELITKGIWSPRLMASRLNMLGISDALALIPGKTGTKGYYSQLHPEIRKEAIKDLAKFATTVMALSLSAAWKFGGQVDTDPDSVSFMDIKFPDGKSYNLTGGFSQYIRLIAQEISGKKTKDGQDKEINRLDNLSHFFRGKVTPVAGVGADLLSGKDFAGQPVTVAGEAQKLAIPLSLQSVVTDIKRDGLSALFNATLPSFVGITVKDKRDFKESGSQKKSKPEKKHKKLKPVN